MSTTPEHLPMLEVPCEDGGARYYHVDRQVLKYVARRTGKFPAGVEEAYTVDVMIQNVMDTAGLLDSLSMGKKSVDDFIFLDPYGTRGDDDDDDLPAQTKRNNLLHRHIGQLELLLGDSPDFFTRGMFTAADLTVFFLVHDVAEPLIPGLLRGFPRLAAHHERVAARPAIQAYLQSSAYAALAKHVPHASADKLAPAKPVTARPGPSIEAPGLNTNAFTLTLTLHLPSPSHSLSLSPFTSPSPSHSPPFRPSDVDLPPGGRQRPALPLPHRGLRDPVARPLLSTHKIPHVRVWEECGESLR